MVLLYVLACTTSPEPQPPPAEAAAVQEAARAKLGAIEDATEHFVNDLLDFSAAVRVGERRAMARYVGASVVSAPWPTVAGEPTSVAHHVARRDWVLSAPAVEGTGESFLQSLDSFVDRLVEVDDVRLKAMRTRTTPDGLVATMKIRIVGRNGAGQREWIKGIAEVEGRQVDDTWTLTRFELSELYSLLSERDLFTEVAGPTRLAQPPFKSRWIRTNFVAGAATADVDGDGLLDVIAVHEKNFALYLNKGDGTFADPVDPIYEVRGSEKGVHSLNHSPLFTDIDNDGDPDLFVTGILKTRDKGTSTPSHDTRLFLNRRVEDGTWSFVDVSERLPDARHTIAGRSPSAVDLNGDRIPDFYVPMWSPDISSGEGRVKPDDYSDATNGAKNHLYLSKPDGTWEEVASAWGIDGHDWSMASGFADYDDDGDFDLFVANDFGRNRLYVNQGQRFVEQADARGVHHGNASMGIHLADYDNDGDLDLHATNMSSTAGERVLSRVFSEEADPGLWADVDPDARKWATGNKLYRNDGDGQFADVSDAQGPFPGGWGWGGGFIDIDNDGWEDVYTPAGRRSGKSMHDT